MQAVLRDLAAANEAMRAYWATRPGTKPLAKSAPDPLVSELVRFASRTVKPAGGAGAVAPAAVGTPAAGTPPDTDLTAADLAWMNTHLELAGAGPYTGPMPPPPPPPPPPAVVQVLQAVTALVGRVATDIVMGLQTSFWWITAHMMVLTCLAAFAVVVLLVAGQYGAAELAAVLGGMWTLVWVMTMERANDDHHG
jgi:hypothetical protein